MVKLEHVIAAVAGAVCTLLGGWGPVLAGLLLLQALDLLSGLASAGARGKVSSWIGWRGLSKKLCTWIAVALAHQIAILTGIGLPLRDGVVLFYVTIEAISVLENLGEAGVPLPDVLVRAIEVLKGKSNSP